MRRRSGLKGEPFHSSPLVEADNDEPLCFLIRANSWFQFTARAGACRAVDQWTLDKWHLVLGSRLSQQRKHKDAIRLDHDWDG